MYGTQRATPYGYSLWEFAVRTAGGSTPPPPTPGPTNPPPDSFWGDTSGIPAARNVVMLKILNRTNGRYPDNQVFWSYNGQAHSIADILAVRDQLNQVQTDIETVKQGIAR